MKARWARSPVLMHFFGAPAGFGPGTAFRSGYTRETTLTGVIQWQSS